MLWTIFPPKLCMMIGAIKFYSLVVVWMTLTIFRGYRMIRGLFVIIVWSEWHEVVNTFAKVDCVREMIAKKSCQSSVAVIIIIIPVILFTTFVHGFHFCIVDSSHHYHTFYTQYCTCCVWFSVNCHWLWSLHYSYSIVVWYFKRWHDGMMFCIMREYDAKKKCL